MGMGANDRQVGGDHYQSAIQHWDYVLANQIPYLEAMIIKYITRWRKKGGYDDLEKTKHFLQKLYESEGFNWYALQGIPEGAAGPGYVDQDRVPVQGPQAPLGLASSLGGGIKPDPRIRKGR